MENTDNKNHSDVGAMKKYLTIKDIFAYSFALFGFQLIVGYLNSYQAEFYAHIMKADFAIIGVLLLIVKSISAIFDPFIGNLIDRTNSKSGKLKPFILYSVVPLLIFTIIIFIEVPFSNAVLYIYIFITFLLWNMSMTLGDVPSQALASVLTPNPTEKTNVISLANTLKSIGLVACVVIVPIICLIVPGGSLGFEAGEPISSNEYRTSSIVIAILGCGLFMLIYVFSKERVPYKAVRMTFKDMFSSIKGNKPLMLALISCFLGFGRQIQTAIGIQSANALIGNQNLVIVLGITAGVGALISMSIMPVLIKKFDEKKVYIGVSIYGFAASILSTLVYVFWTQNLFVTLATLFLVGLQFGVVNILPMIMVADSVDYYEYKTGKRTEGTAYAALSLTIKVTLALSGALGLIMLSVAKYDAAAVASDSTKNLIFISYSLFPGIFSLLSIIPILKYDYVGKKKIEITDELQKRRNKNEETITVDSNNSEI
ncbi:MAG: glycoside-pentoside-hexuronide (GPH):cation symporter [Christensenellaceae bacterium]|jgi:sugar (glycoside-pentoside-hexuronide) transporter|nr:glycoside-pentoside-hexuronide (GPH):cation symporter [Christensenellaceae bacterium]